MQSLQERNLKLENEKSTKLEAGKERVYTKTQLWSVENESRLSLESSADSDVANLIWSQMEQPNDAIAKVSALECELQAYKDRYGPPERPLHRGQYWGPGSWVQDTLLPTPSSLQLHQQEFRPIQAQVYLPATVKS